MVSRSILGPLLPEAMIHYLENYGAEKFAEIFLGEFDTPEAIWNSEMRYFQYFLYCLALVISCCCHFWPVSFVLSGWACESVHRDADQCTNGSWFNSCCTCARLLVASKLCVGFVLPPLQFFSVLIIPRKFSLSSALRICGFHSQKDGAGWKYHWGHVGTDPYHTNFRTCVE